MARQTAANILGVIATTAVALGCHDGLAGDFYVTIHVLNLKAQPLVEGQADDDPATKLTPADLVLTGRAYLGRLSVDRQVNALPIVLPPTLDARDSRRKSKYTIRLSVPNDQRVARLVIKLPGRQEVDLRRIAAVTQVITVSMPEETKMIAPCQMSYRCFKRRPRLCRR